MTYRARCEGRRATRARKINRSWRHFFDCAANGLMAQPEPQYQAAIEMLLANGMTLGGTFTLRTDKGSSSVHTTTDESPESIAHRLVDGLPAATD